MADNKEMMDGRDRSKIDANDANEISYIQKKHNVTRAKIEEAIKAVGNSRDKVEEYLGKAK